MSGPSTPAQAPASTRAHRRASARALAFPAGAQPFSAGATLPVAMRLTVLGNTGKYLAPLSGGSGYLVEEGAARILLDCGGGVRESLRRVGVAKLDALVISHFHFDHVMDFPTLRELLTPATQILVPPGEAARFDALAKAYAFNGHYDLPCPVVEVEPGKSYRVGDLTLRFAPMQHSVPTIATRIARTDGSALVYASDGVPNDALRELAWGCDLLLMHTLLPTVDPKSGHAQRHATAATASAFATVANAKRLLLSHRFHESKDTDMLYEARLTKGLALARDGATYEVP